MNEWEVRRKKEKQQHQLHENIPMPLNINSKHMTIKYEWKTEMSAEPVTGW